MKMNRVLIVLLISVIAIGCAGQESQQQGKRSELLDAYFLAFNNHDVEGLSTMVSEDIRLMSLMPDSMTTDLRGKEELETWLSGYFSSLPNVSSTYSDLTVQEPFYSFVETAQWGPDSARKQQSAMATYLIKENKIHRVWYYYPE